MNANDTSRYAVTLRVACNSRAISMRSNATRRAEGKVQMNAAPVKRPTRVPANNWINGEVPETKNRVNHVALQTTPHKGKCLKNRLHKSPVVTGPCRPAM